MLEIKAKIFVFVEKNFFNALKIFLMIFFKLYNNYLMW